MLHCFQCGKDLPDNLAFCLFCGAQLNDDAATVVRPVVETQPVASGGGAGKFILGSLIGAVSVIALVAIAAFVIMSMRGEDKPQNVIAVPAATPTPTPTKATATPTPVRQTPTPSREVFVKPEPVERVCSVVNPEGGTVNLRIGCDKRDCTMDASTVYTQVPPGEKVIPTGRTVAGGRFTWTQIRYRDEVLWIASSRISCD